MPASRCDANILIEIIHDRRHAAASRKYVEEAPQDLAITMLSLDLIMYYAESSKLDKSAVEQFLRLFCMAPLNRGRC